MSDWKEAALSAAIANPRQVAALGRTALGSLFGEEVDTISWRAQVRPAAIGLVAGFLLCAWLMAGRKDRKDDDNELLRSPRGPGSAHLR